MAIFFGIINMVMKMIEHAPDMRVQIKIVDIDGLVPADHLLREIDWVVDFEQVHEMVEHQLSKDCVKAFAEALH